MSHDSRSSKSNKPGPLDQPARELLDNAAPNSPVSRRHFLEAAGFSLTLAAVGGCRQAEQVTALPPPTQSEGQIPGRALHYASTCSGCSSACGLLVTVRDGRPLKMEGMKEHPLSRGGLCAVGQATTMGLYDSHRLTGPLRNGRPAKWADADRQVLAALERAKTSSKHVRFVTPTVTSPTLQRTIDTFLSQFPGAQHVIFDAVSSSAILDAHEATHGRRILPHYHFDKAKVIVSFGADFLGTWISPVEFTAAWRDGRVPSGEPADMSYHVQFESRVSLTGSNADRRIRIHPTDETAILGQLTELVASRAGVAVPEPLNLQLAEPHEDLASELFALAERLWTARGECLVLSDSQDNGMQSLVNYLNHLLGNYGKTLDVKRPSRQRQGNDRHVVQLIAELKNEQVEALFVAGTDLTQNLPSEESLKAAIEKLPLVVSFAEREDNFASIADFVCPDHHPLESWFDAEPVSGLASLAQPTLRPLNDTRSVLESLTVWSGQRPKSSYEIVRQTWREAIFSRQTETSSFDRFWEQSLRDGFANVDPAPQGDLEFRPQALKLPSQRSASDGYSLVLHNNIGMPDSRHAHNPWLHELPDPVSKVTWGNYVSVSPEAAVVTEQGLTTGDIVQVAASEGDATVELPVLLQPGQHNHVLAIALAYGVQGTDRFAGIGPQWIEGRPTVKIGQTLGENAARFVELHGGALGYIRDGVTLKKTGRRHDLAITQEHHRIEVPAEVAPPGAELRDVVQRTTLSSYQDSPHTAGVPPHHDFGPQLWSEDHAKPGHHWGMVVDLNACSGCSACVIACQAENNIPVVGADEVQRQREMHWIRLDRYYEGDADDQQVAHQPMMCQHCDNAPCETVCPVLATVHSNEGLNEQVYNRCVGTRYCANNCPYKVRRFNWFKYAHDDMVQNLALNPDVTVRSRGVMEKCSMCVQRIEDVRIDARTAGRSILDGEVQTACQQSCPANAIVFGDLNDPESEIHAMSKNPRRYRVLEELNVRPSVSYLRVVKNRDAADTIHHDGEATHG